MAGACSASSSPAGATLLPEYIFPLCAPVVGAGSRAVRRRGWAFTPSWGVEEYKGKPEPSGAL